MRRLALLLGFFSFVLTANATEVSQAQYGEGNDKTVGLGVTAGEPSGFNGKYWFNRTHALVGGIGYSFTEAMAISAEYLVHFPEAFSNSLSPYIGAGGIFLLSTNSGRVRNSIFDFFSERESVGGFGIRAPVGVEWLPRSPSLGVFAEFAPGWGFVPRGFLILAGGVGVRGYF